MATLQEKIEWGKNNPSDPRTTELVRRIQAGEYDADAFNEGLDFTNKSPTFKDFKNNAEVEKRIEELDQSKLDKFSIGVAKSGLRALEGGFQVGKKLADFVNPTTGTADNLLGDKLTQEAATTRKGEGLGVALGEIAQFAVPAAKVGKLQKGAKLGARVAGQAASDATVAGFQSGGDAKATIGSGIASAALTGVGGPLLSRVGKIIKGTSKGLAAAGSGKSGTSIEALLGDTKAAKEQLKKLSKGGKEAVLKDLNDRVQIIRDGTTKVRKEASEAFGRGLDELQSKVKVKPELLNKNITETAAEYGVNPGDTVEEILDNSDFLSAPLARRVKKVNEILERADEFTGDKVREVFKTLDSKKFKNPGGDSDKLNFNQYVSDISKTIKNSLAESDTTGILKKINKEFSQDTQLLEAFESIFGKVKFKSLKEGLATSNKFDELFKQSGLGDEVIDGFFERIGKDSDKFRAQSSVTDSFIKDAPVNNRGFSFSEILQSVTGGTITPEVITNLTIKAGIADEAAKKILSNFKGANKVGKSAIINTLENLFGE